MKQLKKLALVFSALLVVVFSFSFTKSPDIGTSYRNHSIEFGLTTIVADDIDDDFGDPEFEKIYHRVFPSHSSTDPNLVESRSLIFDLHNTSTPFYLRIRNLRI